MAKAPSTEQKPLWVFLSTEQQIWLIYDDNFLLIFSVISIETYTVDTY